MPKLRDYKKVGPWYLDTAPVTETLRQPIPASAAATWASLLDPDAWPVWLLPVNEVQWTSPTPFGVGTTRTIRGRGSESEEEFFVWEDGRRMSFYFVRSSIPIFAAFAEEYTLEPDGDDACVLIWRYALETPSNMRIGQRFVNIAFKKIGQISLGKLATYMEENRRSYEPRS